MAVFFDVIPCSLVEIQRRFRGFCLHANACFLFSPPDLNFLDPCFMFTYMHNNHCHRVTAHLQLNLLLYNYQGTWNSSLNRILQSWSVVYSVTYLWYLPLLKQSAYVDIAICYDKIPKSVVKREIERTSVEKWQSVWNSTTKGNTTNEYFPIVAERLNIKISTNQYLTTMMTGHGNIKSYLYRFNPLNTELNPICQ